MAEKKNTREIIEQTALNLFSQKGYKSISIRDICKEVGIKESSIYYYFPSKRSIMDSLLKKVTDLTDNMKMRFEAEFKTVDNVTEDEMCEVAVAFFEQYLLNTYVYHMIRFLAIERLSDPEALAVYQNIVFELPLQQQEKIFTEMISRGFIDKNSATVLAQEYYSVIYFSFEKNCMTNALDEEHILVAKNEIRNNMRDVYSKMRRQS